MKHPAFDCVIFDIDNVLVDTRTSYLSAIRWTIEIFLTGSQVPFFHKKSKTSQPSILSREDVDQFKLLGGFNDDWDCCYGLLVYLLTLPVKGHTVEDLKKSMNIKQFVKTTAERPLRVNGIVKKLGRPSAVKIEKIARIFQEIYLGREFFELTERKKATYWKKRGLLLKEKPIFRKSTLERFKNAGIKLGIATGRPRFEALSALKRFQFDEVFDAVTTINEVKIAEAKMKKSLRKPHPYSVIETAKKLKAEKLKCLYVGDLPDDIMAAEKAKEALNIESVGFPWYGATPKETILEMKKAGMDHLIKRPSELVTLATGRS